MKVHIIGPNLRDQSKGEFHVHAPGCADMTRSRAYSREHAGDIKTPVEVASLQKVVEYCYADQMAEDEGYTWKDLASDFYVFPCVKNLPDEISGEEAS